jgi:GT2 family glycosyltransferase
MKSQAISVLICTYNRHEMLAKCLHALVDCTDEPPDQVVVVNGGDERTDEVVKSFQGKRGIEVILIKTINKNLATSRNIGIPYCDADIVAMTDDDAEVFPDWVTRMKDAHRRHPEAGAVGGAIVGAMSDASLVSRLSDQVTFPSPVAEEYVRTLPGVNISYKKEVVEALGPQDVALFRGEDVDFNWRTLRLGYKILFDPQIKVLHYHRPTVTRFLRQHYMYGRAYYLVRRKWKEMYCVYPHGLHTGRDVAKAAHFVLAMFYEPIVYAVRMSNPVDKVIAVPLLFTNQVAWRGGMVVQALLEGLR